MLIDPFRIVIASASLLMMVASAAAADESRIADRICLGMDREVPTGGRSRVDCVDDARAIEVDYSQHWAAAVGQALYYGRVLGKQPTVALICDADDLDGPFAGKCREHAFRAAYGARGSVDVVLCPANAETLDDCQESGE